MRADGLATAFNVGQILPEMKMEIDHLPTKQQGELERIKTVLMEEFARSIERATKDGKRNGKILKIILFGSYARSDWVDEPENGYQSDFDLLVVVSHEDLTDIADHWYIAEDKILHDPAIGRTLNIIVHTLSEVNRALSRGEYFWVDILRDGILLYDLPNHPLATPKPLTAADAYEMAAGYFEEGLPSVDRALEMVAFQFSKDLNNVGWRKDAAFTLHQTVERAYACYLLTNTLYFPRSHNIKFLRSLAEDRESGLVAAWPRGTKLDRRRFELLKRAYVEARYSPSYDISIDDLEVLAASATNLRNIVERLCRERLDQVRSDAGL